MMMNRKLLKPASAGGLANQEELVQDTETLFKDLSSKEEVLAVLRGLSGPLRRISLQPCVVTMEQAVKDFRRERVFLNDVPFIPDQVDLNRSNGFSMTLERLVDRLRNQGSRNCDELGDVTDMIMQRACRTSAGADSFFIVQQLFCVEGTFVTQKTYTFDPPIRVDVFVTEYEIGEEEAEDEASKMDSRPSSTHSNPITEVTSTCTFEREQASLVRTNSGTSVLTETTNNNGHSPLQAGNNGRGATGLALCARSEVRNAFAIYDENVMDDITGDEEKDPLPWLDIEAIVVDESNFKKLTNHRSLQLKVTSPAAIVGPPKGSAMVHPLNDSFRKINRMMTPKKINTP
jgi:hypothetical protein